MAFLSLKEIISYFKNRELIKFISKQPKMSIKKILLQLEILLLCLLPWTAYILMLWNYREFSGSIILIGWLFLLVYQIMSSALLLNAKSNNTKHQIIQQLLIGSVFLLIALHQAFTEGSFTQFVLEKIVIDAICLMLAIFILMLFSFDELGITPLILGGFLYWGCYPFVTTYLGILDAKSTTWLTYSQLGIAFLVNLYSQFRVLYRVNKGEIVLNDIFEQKYGVALILGQIFLWFTTPFAILYLKSLL